MVTHITKALVMVLQGFMINEIILVEKAFLLEKWPKSEEAAVTRARQSYEWGEPWSEQLLNNGTTRRELDCGSAGMDKTTCTEGKNSNQWTGSGERIYYPGCLTCWGPTLEWHLLGPTSTGFARSRLGACGLETPGTQNRDTKEIKTQNRTRRAIGEYWIFLHLFSICLYILIQKGGKRAKDGFSVTQRTNRAIPLQYLKHQAADTLS